MEKPLYFLNPKLDYVVHNTMKTHNFRYFAIGGPTPDSESETSDNNLDDEINDASTIGLYTAIACSNRFLFAFNFLRASKP
jgi:hypothetical protein